MKTSDFDYYLPPERIAQTPIEPRDSSRLLVLHRKTGQIEHTTFHQVSQFLRAEDLLVINKTRVIPARLFGYKIPTGGKIEILLLKPESAHTWEVLVGGKGMKAGKRLQIEGGPQAEISAVLDGARRKIIFDQPIEPFLEQIGHMPLPPYIHTPLQNRERYQTVFAEQSGSAAAPTAGLHFTPQLMNTLQSQNIQFARVTLHVGLDTFAPVTENSPLEHKIHTEWCQVTPQTADLINQTRHQGGRVIAVGTTSVRTLESAARFAKPGQTVAPFTGPTDLFILPGYNFRAIDAMITNFHLPKSTLIMLVSAFAGRERILETYQTAIGDDYRFYSFGDAMLID